MLRVNNAGKEKSYSVKPENLNLDEYKNLLLKLTDSLEITGFNMDDLRLRLSHTTTISITEFARCITIE